MFVPETCTKPVLNHGYVRLDTYMGSDQMIVDVARNSVKTSKSKALKDVSLLRYLLRHRHMSPFEFPHVVLQIKAPIVVFRQWFRHRTMSANEQSGRYCIMDTEFYEPSEQRICMQSKDNRQGSGGQLDGEATAEVEAIFENTHAAVSDAYERLLALGLTRELARCVLPTSLYSTMYIVQDLRNLLHFMSLRLDEHAQWEIREYANTIYRLVQPLFPRTCDAFEDYVLNAKTFSHQETNILLGAMNMLKESAGVGTIHEMIDSLGAKLSKRELSAFTEFFGLSNTKGR